jgi:Domain of unknown function (DUF222)/HNH endonuclease
MTRTTKPRTGSAGPTGRSASAASPGSFHGAAPAALSAAELREAAAEAGRQMAASAGRLVLVAAELDRREGWRAEGATSLVAWLAERCGVSAASARALAHVGERLVDLPLLREGLVSGELSFDKVRTLVDIASPKNDEALCALAKECTVRELAEVARSAQGPPSPADTGREHERRGLRFNDRLRTLTAQLEADAYAEVRAGLEARAKALSEAEREGEGEGEVSEGEGEGEGDTSDRGDQAERVRWDQRLADALVAIVRAGGEAPSRAAPTPGRRQASDAGPSAPSPYLVVAHVALATLADEASALGGELEHHGWIGAEVVRRLACDGAVVVALDDDVGHTMYEGRARRDPSGAQRRELWRRDRHCRFPGCAHAIFTHPHHLVPWKPDGPTDLSNLVLLCEHHHRRMHARAWSVSGNANEVLTFVGPSGRVMTSRPSPLWTRVTGPGARGGSVAP